jgi:signal transduction histidine kinase
LWRGVPRELGYLLLAFPIAVIAIGAVQAVFWTGVGLAVLIGGLFLVLAALVIARALGTLELTTIGWTSLPKIETPRWKPASASASDGFWRRFFRPFVNLHYWLYLVWAMFVNIAVTTVSWGITIGWTVTALTGTTYWIWAGFLPNNDREFFLSRVVYSYITGQDGSFDPRLGDVVLAFVVGVIFLATLPFVTRGLTWMHWGIDRAFLGTWRFDELEQEVQELSASRGAAVAAEDQSLRRLERDIHEGPQQRLVRLQMDLASAGRRIDDDPEHARTLLGEAQEQAREALEELRSLSRGFAPPILQDRGLVPALESLVARSTVPVALESSLDGSEQLAPEVERNVYFVAAELLTNVAKHSGASEARLVLRARADDSAGRMLELWVTDNGRGGAVPEIGHGLSGLEERLRGMRGALTVESPAGGPTRIGATLPLDRPVSTADAALA